MYLGRKPPGSRERLMPANVQTFCAFEGTDTTPLARLVAPSGEYPVEADIDSISIRVFNLSTRDETYSNSGSEPGYEFFDTLQTDRGWTTDVDVTGYNLAISLPVEAIPDGSALYQCEAVITLLDGKVIVAAWKIDTIELLSR